MKWKEFQQRYFKTNDRWSGIWYTLTILALVVIALVLVMVFLPASQPAAVPPTNTPMLTGTPDVLTPTPVNGCQPPIVDTDGVVIIGGLLMLILILAVMREVSWFRRNG